MEMEPLPLTLGNVVFKGNAEVENGLRNIELIIPKDIYSLWVKHESAFTQFQTTTSKKTGLSNEISIGGINPNQRMTQRTRN